MLNKESLIELTSNLYRLTLLFPKKEPLRYKMRELAAEILARFLGINFEQGKNLSKYTDEICANLEVLDSFFEVALVQNWVSPSDILAIKKEYDNLRETFKNNEQESKMSLFVPKEKAEENTEKQISPVKNQGPLKEVNQRQEKILEFLKENGRAQVWQIKQIMPDITKRTLRRDFEYMLEQGLIKRIGEKNDTFYQVKIIEA